MTRLSARLCLPTYSDLPDWHSRLSAAGLAVNWLRGLASEFIPGQTRTHPARSRRRRPHYTVRIRTGHNRSKDMKFKEKALNEQTIVITGATSWIGLVTARMAARRGADFVLVAGKEEIGRAHV